MPPNCIDFIVQPIQVHTFEMCKHAYGCRVIQRILEHCTDDQINPILRVILDPAHIIDLTKDQYGNYVIQHILERGKNQDEKEKVVKQLRGKVLELSNHKFASNVVEKCLEYSLSAIKYDLIDEIIGDYEDEQLSLDSPLTQMMKDRYGNYVIQKAIEKAKEKQKD